MNSEGDVIAQHQGQRSVDGFEETGKKAQKYIDLKKKADGGDKPAKIDLLIIDVEAGRVKAADVDKKLAGLGTLSADQKKALDSARANGEVKAIYEPYNNVRNDPAEVKKARLEIGKKLLERKKAGKPVPSGEQEFQMYWFGLLNYAEQQKDANLFEEGYKAIKERFGNLPQAKQALEKMAKTLEALKKGGDAPKGSGE